MEAFREKFKEEANELISDLEQLVLQLEGNKTDQSIVEQVFRVMHSLKGGSAMFGFTLIDQFTHLLENIYDKIRAGELQVTEDILDITLNAVDHLRRLIEETDANFAELAAANKKFIVRIEQVLNQNSPKIENVRLILDDEDVIRKTKTYFISFDPSPDFFQDGSNPLFLLDDLCQLGEAVVVPKYSRIPKLNDIDPTECYMGWNVILTTAEGINAIMDVFIFTNNRSKIEVQKLSDINLLADKSYRKILAETLANKESIVIEALHSLTQDLEKIHSENETLIQRKSSASGHGRDQTISSIRVSSEKLDDLINWVSELVTIQAQLSLFAQQNHDAELTPISEEIEKITRRLRDDVFSIRLIPAANMVTRFQRLIRELSQNLGKDVLFETKGTETELDKNIIEMLVDPVMHIIRNSMDHGIEDTIDERVANGKPATGKILFNAYYSGTNVYIQITDDGKGIDLAKIRRKAIEKGIISPEVELSRKETLDLLFLPGFTTAQSITNLSGRGVGMDVVKRKISDLRGQVEIETELGKGSTVTIKLPLTLSIIDGLLVRIDDTHMVIPLNSVYKVYEYQHEKLEHAINNLILADDERVPAINLRKHFNFETPPPAIERVVTMEYNDHYIGLTIDEIVGEYQAVLKPLGTMFKGQDFFSGATILGDGSVALVLDPNKLVEQFAKNEIKIGG
ncbi:MAG: chemotaxis protein CheA [Salinivirgaceae bacterium]|nr:chemotaxis protein CheA [Salinivirgaceae bacterium]MDY0279686.1 chemotaxis protein CheA [Salinivirgaceae bacterium]